MTHRLFVVVLACASLSPLVLAVRTDAATARAPDQIYQAFCAACHNTGWNGAPITGIKADWEPRMADGIDGLLKNAKQGLNTMPPMGSCADCTDEELKAAIDVMLKF